MDIQEKGACMFPRTAAGACRTLQSQHSCRCAFLSLLSPQTLPMCFPVPFKDIRVARPRSCLLLEDWEEVPCHGFLSW